MPQSSTRAGGSGSTRRGERFAHSTGRVPTRWSSRKQCASSFGCGSRSSRGRTTRACPSGLRMRSRPRPPPTSPQSTPMRRLSAWEPATARGQSTGTSSCTCRASGRASSARPTLSVTLSSPRRRSGSSRSRPRRDGASCTRSPTTSSRWGRCAGRRRAPRRCRRCAGRAQRGFFITASPKRPSASRPSPTCGPTSARGGTSGPCSSRLGASGFARAASTCQRSGAAC